MTPASVSVRDVAALAGVSVGTVSNALNRPELVAPDTLERVLEAIARLGFVRNESARQLRAGSSRTLGLVVLDVTNPFFTDVARGVEDAANDAGLTVILCNTDDRSDKEVNYLDVLEQQRVQGILITPVDVVSDRIAQLRARGMPIVLLDRIAADGDQCSVSVNDVLGGELAATHLLAMGHRRIAFVGGPRSLRQVQDRFDGAQRAVDRHAGPRAELTHVLTPALNTEAGVVAGAEVLGMDPRPTAVFCANDLIALGVLQVAVRGGLRVPEDLAIVGYDDIQFAAWATHPLSSVSQPRRLLGRTAATLLLAERSDHAHHVHQQAVFEPELVIRQSSDHKRAARRAVKGTP
ncbi:MAG: LacI family transcriptional regulator [Frankiaceae bacterium]|jgi:LacI family transcriptional regulator|nr:LacI family transcriptional regulator [Frankiaceae bacterium]